MGKAERTLGPATLRTRVADFWADAWRWCLFASGVAFAVYLLLDRAVPNGTVAAAAIAALAVGVVLTSSEPLAIALMATPALLVTERLDLGGVDLTVSDVALAAALGSAVLLGKHDYSPPMRVMLWANLGYQFATLFTVIINPYTQNTVEWFHAWLLVSGSLIVGWTIGRAGRAPLAFTLLLGGAAVIALGTFLTAFGQFAAADFFTPVYPNWPWAMHKNFAGGILAFAAFIAYVNPPWAELSRQWMRVGFWVFLAALVLTQSRQAAIGLAVALLVVTLRRGAGNHILLVAAIVIPGVILVVQSVIEQVDSQNQHNSFYQRLDWLREVYALWKHSPIIGHGLRYWYVHPSANFQPPQAEVEVLASTGVVGLVAFIAMWIVMLVVLWRVDPTYGMLAFGLVLSRLVQAQFDLFWVAAQVSVPFLVAGICLGAQAASKDKDADSSSERRAGRVGTGRTRRVRRARALAGPGVRGN